jgi:hypothetical protein
LIDFRYHIVSITAVFLALGIGVAVGATVLDQVTVDALRGQLERLETTRDEGRASISELRAEAARHDSLVETLATRMTGGVLTERQVIFVDQTHGAPWVKGVRDAVTGAGATNMGSIEFTGEWGRRVAPAKLGELYIEAGLELPETDTAEGFMRILGQHAGDAAGRELLDKLAEAGYVRIDLEADGLLAGAAGVAVFTDGPDDRPEAKRIAAFVQGLAEVLPALVAAGGDDDAGAVAVLRAVTGEGGRLATFDSAADDDTGVGSVLALQAATEDRGGHFGTASGLSYLPPPA